MIPQLIETLRELAGDHCSSHAEPEDGCATCTALALLQRVDDGPVGLYRAPAPYGSYGQFLVTLYSDGSGELARRDEEGQTWSPAVPLRPA